MDCCFDCRFFVPEGKTDASKLTEADWDSGACEGECRRHPPHLGDLVPKKDDDFWRTYGIWPRVIGADWCGEFERRAGVPEADSSCGVSGDEDQR